MARVAKPCFAEAGFAEGCLVVKEMSPRKWRVWRRDFFPKRERYYYLVTLPPLPRSNELKDLEVVGARSLRNKDLPVKYFGINDLEHSFRLWYFPVQPVRTRYDKANLQPLELLF